MSKLTPKQLSKQMSKVRAHRTTPGYFSTLSKEELSVIGKMGGRPKKNANPQEEEPQTAS